MNTELHQLSLHDLIRVCHECDEGFVVLHRVGAEHPVWGPLVGQIARRYEEPLSAEDYRQSVPGELFIAFLSAIPYGACENPYDGVLRDCKRMSGDAPIDLVSLYLKYGAEAVYKVLEAGGYMSEVAPLRHQASRNFPLPQLESSSPTASSNDEGFWPDDAQT